MNKKKCYKFRTHEINNKCSCISVTAVILHAPHQKICGRKVIKSCGCLLSSQMPVWLGFIHPSLHPPVTPTTCSCALQTVQEAFGIYLVFVTRQRLSTEGHLETVKERVMQGCRFDPDTNTIPITVCVFKWCNDIITEEAAVK